MKTERRLSKNAVLVLVSDPSADNHLSAPKGISPAEALQAFSELKEQDLVIHSGKGFQLTDAGIEYRQAVILFREKEVKTLPRGKRWSSSMELFVFATPQAEDGSCMVFTLDREVCLISYFGEDVTNEIVTILNGWDKLREDLKHVVPTKTYTDVYNRAVESDKLLAKATKLIMELGQFIPPGHPLNFRSKDLVQRIVKMPQSSPTGNTNDKPKNPPLSVVSRSVPPEGPDGPAEPAHDADRK